MTLSRFRRIIGLSTTRNACNESLHLAWSCPSGMHPLDFLLTAGFASTPLLALLVCFDTLLALDP